MTIIRIPDSCRVVRGPAGLKLLRINSPFDYVLLSKGEAVIFDAKTLDTKTFPYSAITPHQLNSLQRCSVDALRSGYLVHFRPTSKVIFFSSHQLRSLQPHSSLTAEQGFDLGTPGSICLDRLFQSPDLTLGAILPRS